MMNWTDEAVRAEANYRREALHRMVSRRRDTKSRGTGVFSRVLARHRH